MKKIYSILAISLLMVCFAGCKKEKLVTLSVQTEDYTSNSKAYIDGNFTCWDNNDQVKINNEVRTVSVTTSAVSIPSVTSATDYYAVYPAACCSGNVSASTSILVPAVQKYQVVNGHQKLQAPMAAKAKGNVLFFKNLCTVWKVTVPSGRTVYSIRLTSSSTPLSGTANVTFDGSGNPTLGAITGLKTVTLDCGDGVTGQNDFYIAVPAIPANETITIRIVSKSGENVYISEKSSASSAAVPANFILPINASSWTGTTGENGYTWVKAIKGNGVPYINTGVPGNNDNLAFEGKFKYTKTPTNYSWLFGSYIGENYNSWRIIVAAETRAANTAYFNMNTKTENAGVVTWAPGTIISFRMVKNYLTYNGANKVVNGSAAPGTANSNPIGLLGAPHNGNSNRDAGLTCYGFAIYDNGAMIRDFVPCTDGSNYGMYDLANNTFYGNVRGSGEFVLGN